MRLGSWASDAKSNRGSKQPPDDSDDSELSKREKQTGSPRPVRIILLALNVISSATRPIQFVIGVSLQS
jgi:hypothetical protein